MMESCTMFCARRLGRALIGKVDPTIERVVAEGRALVDLLRPGEPADLLGLTLKAVYDDTVNEPVPPRLTAYLDALGDAPRIPSWLAGNVHAHH